MSDKPTYFDTDIHSGMKPLDKHWEWWMERPVKGPPLTRADLNRLANAYLDTFDEVLKEQYPQLADKKRA